MTPASVTLGDGQQLDDEAHLLGGRDVLRRDLRDALAVDVVERHPSVEGQLGEDRRLRGRVVTLDVGRRIRLGVAERLGLREDGRVVGALLVHLGEDEVRGAVDDAEHLGDLVAGERLAQRPQQRDGSGDGGLEVQVDAVARGRLVEGGAVGGQQGLVGRDDARAGGHGRQDQRAGRLDAAHHLDDDVGTARGDGRRIGRDEVGRDARTGLVQRHGRRPRSGRRAPRPAPRGRGRSRAGAERRRPPRCRRPAGRPSAAARLLRTTCELLGTGVDVQEHSLSGAGGRVANPAGAGRAFSPYSPTRETMCAIASRRPPPTPSGGSS